MPKFDLTMLKPEDIQGTEFDRTQGLQAVPMEYGVSCSFCYGLFGRGTEEGAAVADAVNNGMQCLSVMLPGGASAVLQACPDCRESTVEKLIRWHER